VNRSHPNNFISPSDEILITCSSPVRSMTAPVGGNANAMSLTASPLSGVMRRRQFLTSLHSYTELLAPACSHSHPATNTQPDRTPAHGVKGHQRKQKAHATHSELSHCLRREQQRKLINRRQHLRVQPERGDPEVKRGTQERLHALVQFRVHDVTRLVTPHRCAGTRGGTAHLLSPRD
jgi:hypothetical protein